MERQSRGRIGGGILTDTSFLELWNAANDSAHPRYMEALHYLSRNQANLRAPILFVVPAASPQRWYGLMTRSLDMCRCGRRRLIMPQHPHGFEAGDEVEPLLVGGESTLSLGYWGGDRESTLMRLSVAHAQLIIDILPYTGQSAAELQARGLEQHVITSNPQIVEGQGGEPAYVTYDAVTVDPRQGSYVLSDLKGHLAKRGALEFPSGFPCGHRTLHLTPYAITAVDEATGTVSILPNRWFKVIDTAKDEALHVC